MLNLKQQLLKKEQTLMTLEEEYNLSCYEELTTLGNHNNIYLVKHKLSGEIFVKKVLSRFSFAVYEQLKNLKIDGIPRIYKIFLENDHLILIEDYIHGQTLEQMLKNFKNFPESTACKIILKLCKILKQLHLLKPPIIHRDLKLSNIILTNERHLYLVDFDTARHYESGQQEDTQLLGTREYAAPEQYGFGQSDARSDIYALGIILNRLLTGQYPKHQLACGNLEPIISKCIRWEPSERFQTIDDLETAIVSCLDSENKNLKQPFENSKKGIPGFRTRKLWKMCIALLGYIFCFYCSMTIQITETTSSIPLTGTKLWYERLFMLAIFLSLIFYNCDYKNIRTISFRGHSFPLWLRILIQCGFSILIVLFFMFIMIIFEEIIW